MKVNSIISLAVAVAVSFLSLISCGSKSDLAGGDWVAKINDDEITINMLNAYYYAQQKQIYNVTNEEIDKLGNNPDAVSENPTLDKEEFLENYIRQRLVFNKAVKDGMLNDPEVKAHIEMAKEAVVVAQYVKTKFKSEINISQEEIADAYSKYSEKFKGVPIEKAEQYIQQNLYQQKLQIKLKELVDSLKEQSIISKNLAPLKASMKEKKAEESKKDESKQKLEPEPQKSEETKK